MIKDQTEFLAARQRFDDLRAMRKKIVSDSRLNHRQRTAELAGVRGLLEEIEREIRQYQLLNLQEKLEKLQVLAKKTPPEKIPEILTQMIAAMQELTHALQPAA